MKFSKYVHFFDINSDVVGLFHSLLIRTVFLSRQEKEVVESYLNGKKEFNEAITKIIKHLYSHYFIIGSDEDDNRVFDGCLKSIPEPVISNTYFVVTENCNFKCKYCFISDTVESDNKDKIMTTKVAKAAVELLSKTYEKYRSEYERTIIFYGGEPLLNFDVIKYVLHEINDVKLSGYWPDNVKLGVVTNGSLLTKEHIDFFRSNNINLTISYDVDKESHANRLNKIGNTTFDVVKSKIKMCADANMPYSLSVVISEDTLKNKDFVLENIISLSPASVGFNMLLPNKYIKPSDAYYERATEFMIDCFKSFRQNGIYEDRIMRKISYFANNKMFPYDCCAAGGNQFVIAPNGEIGICHGYLNNNKFFSANVFDKDFDFRKNNDFNYWKKRSPIFMAECQNCECIGICGGGCGYAADYLHGSIYAKDDRFCIHCKKILKWLIKDLYEQTVAV